MPPSIGVGEVGGGGVQPPPAMEPGEPAISVDEAFAYCARVTARHYENFPVASLFLPAEQRPYIQALYAFSRGADDIADEPGLSDEERLGGLDAWGAQLRAVYDGAEAHHPVFIALAETVRRTGIPIEPLADLLTAFRRDVTQRAYETFDDLLGYCRCSANPVGRLVLMLFGCADDELFARSDDICTALQLTNFWQDLALDRERGRRYLPAEEMALCGYEMDAWDRGVGGPEFQRVMETVIGRTRELFLRGAPLTARVDRDLQIELRLVWLGGMSVLRRVERKALKPGSMLLPARPALGAASKLAILARAFTFDDVVRADNFWRRERLFDL